MIKADNQAIDFVMRIVNDIIERELARDTRKYGNLMVIDTTDMRLDDMRLELWYCFLEQYQIKKTPKLGIMVLEIV